MLTNELRVVVGSAVPEKILKDAKKDLAPGTYLVDALVRVQGTLDKGEDFDMKVAAKVDWKLLASLALSKLNNETQDKVIGDFVGTLGVNSDEARAAQESLADGIKARVEGKIEQVMGAAPTVKANGRVTAKLVAEVVGDAKVEFHQK
jgi:hypothetical protein